jgi:hypothetical protein
MKFKYMRQPRFMGFGRASVYFYFPHNTTTRIDLVHYDGSVTQHKTCNSHLSSYAVCYNVYKIFQLVLKSNNAGLCNWFLYTAKCPRDHCPLLENTRGSKIKTRKDILFQRILSQDSKIVPVYILRMISWWWTHTSQASPLHILSYFTLLYHISYFYFETFVDTCKV